MRLSALILLMASSLCWATESAEADYMLSCQGCHLPDGRGFPDRQVPDLRQQMGQFLKVPGGREFLVQVPGSAQTALSDADLARLLNWMLVRFSREQLPADFQPFSAAEVATLRKTPLVNVTTVRSNLLHSIARQEQQSPSGALHE